MYYALLHADDSIVASGPFLECLESARALYPPNPGNASDYYLVSENWFKRSSGEASDE